ncbi:MAG: lipoate--protein ligase family protein [Pirellulales bacterium]|nr:lipoate--protein ligase family protein [Pirellulales bacterium]
MPNVLLLNVSGASSKTRWQLLIDPPRPGAWNMAVDQVLLQQAAAQGRCCCRFYQWSEPTVSLGYFQRIADRREHTASMACPIVRRLTGGGAIVHDVELTYSLAVPGGHPLAIRRNTLYQTVHGSLIRTLAELGIDAALYKTQSVQKGGIASEAQPPQAESHRQPFLCFQRRSVGDVLLDAAKIAGSAQRRRRGAVLQHGSVLLRRSRMAPEVLGIEELTKKKVALDDLLRVWRDMLGKCLAADWQEEPLRDQQRDEVAGLAENRYVSDRWNEHRDRPPQKYSFRLF